MSKAIDPYHGEPPQPPSLLPLLAVAVAVGGILLLVIGVSVMVLALNRSADPDLGDALAGGDADARTAGEMSDIANGGGPANSGSDEPIDLLAAIDLERDAIRGDFRFENGALIVPDERQAHVELPTPPPPAYRLEMVVQKISGEDSINMGIVCGSSQTMVVFDAFDPKCAGLNLLNGRSADRNSTKHVGRVFTPGSPPRTIVITVRSGRPASVHVTCDGVELINWRGDPDQLTIHKRIWTITPDRFMLGAWDTSFKITKLELTKLPD